MAINMREEMLRRWQAQYAARKPIIGCAVGAGISARSSEAGGADFLVIYNAARFRMAGHPSLTGLLAYSDANAVVMEMADEVLPAISQIPVLAGINGTDPFRSMNRFLKHLKEIGFSGVQNVPTVGLVDGNLRRNLEASGLGYDKEVAAIATARELDLLTAPYVFDEEQAIAMAEAGADLLVVHVGVTALESAGPLLALSLDEAIDQVERVAAAGRSVNSELLVMCHGGPFGEPDVVGDALTRMPGVAGFFGATTTERAPIERAVAEQVRQFKGLRLA